MKDLTKEDRKMKPFDLTSIKYEVYFSFSFVNVNVLTHECESMLNG